MPRRMTSVKEAKVELDALLRCYSKGYISRMTGVSTHALRAIDNESERTVEVATLTALRRLTPK